jgi:hypothetical protein
LGLVADFGQSVVGRRRLLLGLDDRMLLGGQMTNNATPIRTVRVDNKLWKAAKVQAKRSETTVSEVIVQALRDFTAK